MKIKKGVSRSQRLKTQTPISRQTISIRKILCTHTEGICIFIKFIVQAQKGYSIPCTSIFRILISNYSLALSLYHNEAIFSIVLAIFRLQLFCKLFGHIIYGNIKTRYNVFRKCTNDVFGEYDFMV